jgi:hypothetical protein
MSIHQTVIIPDMDVSTILHRIKHQLPRTNYKPARVKALILSIDGINLSKSALRSRIKKIIEAHHELQYTYHRLTLVYKD